MALTITPLSSGGGIRPMRMMGSDDFKIVFTEIKWDTSYPASGESLPASSVNLTEIVFVLPAIAPMSGIGGDARAAIGASYDYTNSKLLAINLTAGTECKAASDLLAFKTYLMIVGN